MDSGASASRRNVLERLLLDESAEPTDLPLSLLEDITESFCDDREIGKGGFAVVYKGMLGNRPVAVKKLSNTHMHEKKFHQEVECLMKVKHGNIVRFLGYCADTQGKMEKYNGKFVMADVQQRLLCFEYLPKGSLDKYITDASCGLEWRERYRIIEGICKGLQYLQQNRIVHLDLKPANVLLDHNMVPKITDFGLSRCFDETQSRDITSKLLGTMGYFPPEFYSGKITFKSDTYSLGIIIAEMLTGEKGYCSVDEVLEFWRNRLDKSQEDKELKQVRVCAEICIECTEFNPERRPGIENIIDRLDETKSTNSSIEIGVGTSVPQAETYPNNGHQGTPTNNVVPAGETTSKGSNGSVNIVVRDWEAKEVVSRDGVFKLCTQVLFASIDQRSVVRDSWCVKRCTSVVNVVANWFQASPGLMPIRSQFDSLIREGALEWRKLCMNKTYLERFPDKHFDLETTLDGMVRPLIAAPHRSYIGFFRPESHEKDASGFDFHDGAMSFGGIWDEISRAAECSTGKPALYIVNWNNYFFILLIEANAYYIIDTLGERLYKGCNKAYILKFDDKTAIYKETNTQEGELVLKGKESCKEYIKRFLAAIPIRQLQADIRKGLMASTPLHQRLQIKFHYTEPYLGDEDAYFATEEETTTWAGFPKIQKITFPDSQQEEEEEEEEEEETLPAPVPAIKAPSMFSWLPWRWR